MNPRLHRGKAPHRDHGTGLRWPAGRRLRRPGGPGRDPPGSRHGRSCPAGLAVHAAGPMLTMALTRIVLTVAPRTTYTAPGLSQAKR